MDCGARIPGIGWRGIRAAGVSAHGEAKDWADALPRGVWSVALLVLALLGESDERDVLEATGGVGCGVAVAGLLLSDMAKGELKDACFRERAVKRQVLRVSFVEHVGACGLAGRKA